MTLDWRRWLKARTPIRPEAYVGGDAARNEQAARDGFVAKARRFLRGVPMAGEVLALDFCMLDARTPVWARATAAAALAYFVLPTDAVPDFLPVVGMADDLSVLSAAIAALSGHITEEHRARARAWLAE
jgi:uncharacterized membrane protein YkvA (DUF1232 family)